MHLAPAGVPTSPSSRSCHPPLEPPVKSRFRPPGASFARTEPGPNPEPPGLRSSPHPASIVSPAAPPRSANAAPFAVHPGPSIQNRIVADEGPISTARPRLVRSARRRPTNYCMRVGRAAALSFHPSTISDSASASSRLARPLASDQQSEYVPLYADAFAERLAQIKIVRRYSASAGLDSAKLLAPQASNPPDAPRSVT